MILWILISSNIANAADSTAAAVEAECHSCRFPLSTGCPDPRIYKRNSLYFSDIENDLANEWHTQKENLLGILSEKYERDGKVAGKYVLAGLQFICSKNGDLNASMIRDLPYLFLSGSQFVSNIKTIKHQENEEGIEKEWGLRSVDSYIECEDVTTLIAEINQQLRDLFLAEIGASKLAPEFVQSRLEEIKESESGASKRRRKSNPSTPQNYFHSEQALNLFLESCVDEYMIPHMPYLLEQLSREEDNDCQVYIIAHVVSSNEMCRRCGTTFFRQSERNDKIRKTVSDYINRKLLENRRSLENPTEILLHSSSLTSESAVSSSNSEKASKVDFITSADMLQLLTVSSGTRVFDRPKREVLEKQDNSIGTPIGINVICPHVIVKFGEEASVSETTESVL